ncbi:MAG: adenosylmethionine--8-amino-7-oxononanoate transaminase [Pseudomonadota bacterium]|nr:adenosylmethionine--8-amino-7-oxononanoate transaminase [Pseudomonadota bacterium]
MTDIGHLWYPYTQMKHMKAPFHVTGADGVYMHTDRGDLIDATSSWWCMIYGYRNEEICRAMAEQAMKLPHVMMANVVHDGARDFSDRLAEILPGTLNHVFFSDSGSVSVEIALKMGYQYFVNQKKPRKKILSLKNAYHGDTFMAMSVGDDEDFHGAFPKNPDVTHIPVTIEALEDAFRKEGEQYCSMIVEPLLQGAGGMKMYDASFLKRARELCDEYGVILIYDEVATGFGRTGHRFAADLVCPDIICLGKALTGGHIGHAATVANDRVYSGFWSDSRSDAFMHGPTFMANPIAMAAGLKSLEIFEREHTLEKIKNIERIVKRELEGFHPEGVKETRAMGSAFAIEAENPADLAGFQDFAAENGVFARPFLDVQYGMLPSIITEEQIKQVIDVMKAWWTDRRNRG